MKYWLILLALALAVAPLTHFVPSKRQRHQARLREYAAVHGLFVEFRDLPGVSASGRAEPVIYYGKRLPASRGAPRLRRAWLREGEGWRGTGHRDAAPVGTGEFPATVLALSEDEGSRGAYWREEGEEADVRSIVAALEAWGGAREGALRDG